MSLNPVMGMTAVSALIETPRLARVYVYCLDNGPVTVPNIQQSLELSRGTAYDDVDRLERYGLVTSSTPGQPVEYEATPVELTIVSGGEASVISPEFLRAIAGRHDEYSLDVFAERRSAAAVAQAVEVVSGGGDEDDLAEQLGLSRVEATAVHEALSNVVE